MVATREGPLGEFSELTPVAGINDIAAIDRAPWIDADASVMYFETDRDGSSDIYRSFRKGTVFADPEEVGELNTNSDESAPVLQANGLAIFFSSTRAGGSGGNDVWMATRSDPDDGFGMADNVTEVNSTDFDWPTWISPDGCRLYLGSRRNVGGEFDLFLAERE
jgi:Tol biopolymer transport system component